MGTSHISHMDSTRSSPYGCRERAAAQDVRTIQRISGYHSCLFAAGKGCQKSGLFILHPSCPNTAITHIFISLLPQCSKKQCLQVFAQPFLIKQLCCADRPLNGNGALQAKYLLKCKSLGETCCYFSSVWPAAWVSRETEQLTGKVFIQRGRNRSDCPTEYLHSGCFLNSSLNKGENCCLLDNNGSLG